MFVYKFFINQICSQYWFSAFANISVDVRYNFLNYNLWLVVISIAAFVGFSHKWLFNRFQSLRKSFFPSALYDLIITLSNKHMYDMIHAVRDASVLLPTHSFSRKFRKMRMETDNFFLWTKIPHYVFSHGKTKKAFINQFLWWKNHSKVKNPSGCNLMEFFNSNHNSRLTENGK